MRTAILITSLVFGMGLDSCLEPAPAYVVEGTWETEVTYGPMTGTIIVMEFVEREDWVDDGTIAFDPESEESESHGLSWEWEPHPVNELTGSYNSNGATHQFVGEFEDHDLLHITFSRTGSPNYLEGTFQRR